MNGTKIMSIINLWTGGGRRVLAVGLAAASLACFTKDEVRGLPCTKDAHCGDLLKCEQGFCGGIDLQYGADPCLTGANECADASTLSRCIGGQQQDTSCDLYCSTLGLVEAIGCFKPSSGDGQCHCREDLRPCTDIGVRECTSSGRNLQECDAGYTQSITDCDRHCGALGLGAVGCSEGAGGAECLCYETTTCSWQQGYCLDDQIMVECVDGNWSEVVCSTACPQGLPLGCGYRSDDDEFTCLCAY